MNIDQEREKLILFTKVGAVVLTSFALLASSILLYPKHQEVISNSILHPKELPIYCVEKDKAEISLSFDAAWGNCQYGQIRNLDKFESKNNVDLNIV